MTRDEARAAREAIPPDVRRRLSARIVRAVLDWPVYQAAGTVMAYASYGAEAETGALLADILASGRTLALPRCAGGGVMDARRVTDLAVLMPGAYGIGEPGGDAQRIAPDAIDLILVPGLCFDPRGNRIGHGAGYYDRYLAACRGPTCGLAFAAQVVPALTPKPHDIPVGALATEHGIIIIGRNGE